MHPVRYGGHEESRKRSASLYPLAKVCAPKSELLCPLSQQHLDIRLGVAPASLQVAREMVVKKIC